MIDTRDKTTVDAFPVKRRGRPSTGKAMTGAERIAAKRARDRQAAEQADYTAISTTGLLEAIADAVRAGNPEEVKRIAAQLVKRAKAV